MTVSQCGSQVTLGVSRVSNFYLTLICQLMLTLLLFPFQQSEYFVKRKVPIAIIKRFLGTELSQLTLNDRVESATPNMPRT